VNPIARNHKNIPLLCFLNVFERFDINRFHTLINIFLNYNLFPLVLYFYLACG